MRELVARQPIANQDEFASLLRERGYAVTQATVSRDIAELGLVKVTRADRHIYASPDDLATTAHSDDALRRLLTTVPLTVRRSGLTLLLIGGPGSAQGIAEAIDHSTLTDQEGTLAGENTVLVLFADDERLERWHARFRELQGLPALARPPASRDSTPLGR